MYISPLKFITLYMSVVLAISDAPIGKGCEILLVRLYPEIVRKDRGLGHHEGPGGKAAKNISGADQTKLG